MKDEKRKLWPLFIAFLKIGTFTFGGGYAMISLIQREVVDKNNWISEKDLTDIITISETTPGPISINVATYVGYKIAGNLGALCATIGTIISPFFIIIMLSTILESLQENMIFQNAFWGIRVGAIALIVNVLIKMCKKCSKTVYTYITISISLILLLVFKVNSIYIIISFILARIMYFVIKNRNNFNAHKGENRNAHTTED